MVKKSWRSKLKTSENYEQRETEVKIEQLLVNGPLLLTRMLLCSFGLFIKTLPGKMTRICPTQVLCGGLFVIGSGGTCSTAIPLLQRSGSSTAIRQMLVARVEEVMCSEASAPSDKALRSSVALVSQCQPSKLETIFSQVHIHGPCDNYASVFLIYRCWSRVF